MVAYLGFFSASLAGTDDLVGFCAGADVVKGDVGATEEATFVAVDGAVETVFVVGVDALAFRFSSSTSFLRCCSVQVRKWACIVTAMPFCRLSRNASSDSSAARNVLT